MQEWRLVAAKRNVQKGYRHQKLTQKGKHPVSYRHVGKKAFVCVYDKCQNNAYERGKKNRNGKNHSSVVRRQKFSFVTQLQKPRFFQIV